MANTFISCDILTLKGFLLSYVKIYLYVLFAEVISLLIDREPILDFNRQIFLIALISSFIVNGFAFLFQKFMKGRSSK